MGLTRSPPHRNSPLPMLVPPVSTWVTLWSLLAHHAKAWNSTLIPSDLPEDYTIEKSVQLAHLEGSGFDVITDNYSTMFTSLSYAESVRSNIKKRAADFYNGLVGPEFYSPFTIKAPRFPPNAVIGLSRPLQRGLRPPQVHYVAIWYPTNRAPRWGSIYFDQRMNVEGTFIQRSPTLSFRHVAQWPEAPCNVDMESITVPMTHQAFHSSGVGKLAPDLSGRIASLALYIGRLARVVKERYAFSHPQTMHNNEVECMAHVSGIDQRRELYPLSFMPTENLMLCFFFFAKYNF